MPILSIRNLRLAVPLLCAFFLAEGSSTSLDAAPKSAAKEAKSSGKTEKLTPAEIWRMAKPDAVKLAPAGNTATANRAAASSAKSTTSNASSKRKSAATPAATATDSRLKSASSDVAALKPKKFLFLYFSAHWCPPCRAFTPQLVEFYNENKENNDFELLFVSSDHGIAQMADYMEGDKMPWMGLKPGSKSGTALKQKYGITGIPTLILLDKDGNILTNNRSLAFSKYQSLRAAKPAAAAKPATAKSTVSESAPADESESSDQSTYTISTKRSRI